jgi:hypothetical protein
MSFVRKGVLSLKESDQKPGWLRRNFLAEARPVDLELYDEYGKLVGEATLFSNELAEFLDKKVADRENGIIPMATQRHKGFLALSDEGKKATVMDVRYECDLVNGFYSASGHVYDVKVPEHKKPVTVKALDINPMGLM